MKGKSVGISILRFSCVYNEDESKGGAGGWTIGTEVQEDEVR